MDICSCVLGEHRPEQRQQQDLVQQLNMQLKKRKQREHHTEQDHTKQTELTPGVGFEAAPTQFSAQKWNGGLWLILQLRIPDKKEAGPSGQADIAQC